MRNQIVGQTIESKISLKSMIQLLTQSWRIFLVTEILCIFAAGTYIFFTPIQFEAIANIQMAEINISEDSNVSTLIPVEEPSLLIARMRQPTSYTNKEIDGCGLNNLANGAEVLANNVMISPIKGVKSVVELKIRMNSRDLAVSCVNVLFEAIQDRQNKLAQVYVDEIKTLITLNANEFKKLEGASLLTDEALSGISKRHTLVNNGNFILFQIVKLNKTLASSLHRKTKLIAPVYGAAKEISPPKKNILIISFFAGLFLSLMFALAKSTEKYDSND